MKVEKVVVEPTYKIEVTFSEYADIRMAVYECSCDDGYLQVTRDRLKRLYETIRTNA